MPCTLMENILIAGRFSKGLPLTLFEQVWIDGAHGKPAHIGRAALADGCESSSSQSASASRPLDSTPDSALDGAATCGSTHDPASSPFENSAADKAPSPFDSGAGEQLPTQQTASAASRSDQARGGDGSSVNAERPVHDAKSMQQPTAGNSDSDARNESIGDTSDNQHPEVSNNANICRAGVLPTARLSPQLALNLGLGCHLQPFFRAEPASKLPTSSSETVVIQAYTSPAANSRQAVVHIAAPQLTRVPAAFSITVSHIPTPELAMLPTESTLEQQQQQQEQQQPGGQQQQQQPQQQQHAGGEGGAAPQANPPLAATLPPARLTPAAPAESASGDAPVVGEQQEAHDNATLDAFTAAVVLYFQALPRLLCLGDVFGLWVPITDPLDATAAALHGRGVPHQRLVHFQVVELTPGEAS